MQNNAVPTPSEARAISIEREHKDIFLQPKLGERLVSHLEYLLAKEEGPGNPGASKEMAAHSGQGVTLGRKWQPFNMRGMTEFQSSNPHHSACIQTKKFSTVGLGFRNPEQGPVGTGGTIMNALLQQSLLAQNKPMPPGPDGSPNPQAIDPKIISETVAPRQKPTKADLILNPLTSHTFLDVMLLIAEDYHQVGNGYMEIIRKAGDGKITGIHHIPAATVFPWVENYNYDYHYEIIGDEGVGGSRHFARWGDSAAFAKRNGRSLSQWFGLTDSNQFNPGMVSEVISFQNPSSRNRWYGFPDWLSCVSSIELLQCLHQYKYDFFLNRGVPEFMLWVTGAKVQPDDWTKVEAALKGNIGQGNSHKSIAMNLSNKDVVVKLEKLAMDGHGEGADFATQKDTLALDIVSAHRVPPLLAGIQIPGKLGANNELPNALMAFQVLVIGPTQRKFQQTLAMTLGNPEQNGGLDLTAEDLLFRTITEEIDVGTLDTQSRMKMPVTQAKAQGRDISQGLKD